MATGGYFASLVWAIALCIIVGGKDLPPFITKAPMVLVFGWPTTQQTQREKSQRCDLKHIVHENTYRSMDGEELREMFAHKYKNSTYEEWCSAFCKRKYNSDFSKEMTRFVEKYLESFKENI